MKRKCPFSCKKKIYNNDWKWIYINGEKSNYRIHKDTRVSSKNLAKGDEIVYKAPVINKNGYYYVSMCHKAKMYNVAVHKLVALAFIPKVKGKPYINHIDGNKLNNSIENLEWCTPKENNEHASHLGLLKSGANTANSKYTEEVIRKICEELVKNELGQKEIAEKYGIKDASLISNLKRYKTWPQVVKDYDFSHYNKRTKQSCSHQGENAHNTNLKNETVENICKMLASGNWTIKGIAAYYDIKYKTVQQIHGRENWRFISDKYDFSNYAKNIRKAKNN